MTNLSEDRFVQIQPSWIALLDQRDFPIAFPVLDLLFALYGSFDGWRRFKPDQVVYRVAVRKAFDKSILVLVHTAHEVASHAHVQRAVLAAGHEVDEILHTRIVRTAWIAGQARNDKFQGLSPRAQVVIPGLTRDPCLAGTNVGQRDMDCGSSPQ